MNISAVVTGDAALVARLVPSVAVAPKHRFLTRSAIVVQGNARRECPVDTGRLRNSIAYAVEGDRATVGTNLRYGAFVHFGTRPHFPPPAALAGWAGRHGTDPFLVARGIARHGTKAHPFLADGFEQSIPAIQNNAVAMGREIVAALGGG